MSSIEQRIEKHKLKMAILDEQMKKHNGMVLKWMQKYKFHECALNKLRAKQEKKAIIT